MIEDPIAWALEFWIRCIAAIVYRMRDDVAPWLVDANICRVVKSLVLLNGLYDLVCAWCILVDLAIQRQNYYIVLEEEIPSAAACIRFMAGLHAGVWKRDAERNNPLVRRLLAYWILTYGLVRLLYGLSPFPTPSSCGGEQPASAWMGLAAMLTYLVEAFAYYNEKGVVHLTKATFVYSTCLIMGAWLLRCHFISCPEPF